MAHRTLTVLNSGGNVEYVRDLGPYERVVVTEEGESVVVQATPFVTENQIADGAIPQSVVDAVLEATS